MFVISSSYGNDSMALISYAVKHELKDVHVVYIDTGWASDTWGDRVNEMENKVKSYGFKVYRIRPKEQFRDIVIKKKAFPKQ